VRLRFETKQEKRLLPVNIIVSDVPVGFKIFRKETNASPEDSAVPHNPVCMKIRKTYVNENKEYMLMCNAICLPETEKRGEDRGC
jgi:hypothetical protein